MQSNVEKSSGKPLFKVREGGEARLRAEFDNVFSSAVLSRGLSLGETESLRCKLAGKLRDGSLKAFDCVPVPSVDQTKTVLAVVVSESFKQAVSKAADETLLNSRDIANAKN